MLCGWLGKYLTLPFVVWTFFTFVPGVAQTAEKQGQALERITIAYSSLSGNMAPLWITHERGFFQKYGLDVQIVFIESGRTAVESLISKEVAFAQMAGAGVLQSNLRGADVVLIAGFLNTMDYQLMVHKSITRPDQLRGKTIAVSRFGSSSDFATRYALNKYGLVPEKDVTILEIGSQPARFAALESGKIQAAMIAVPLTLKAKALGFHALADLQMLGLEYQHTGLATARALIKARPELIRNVMKAYIEGIHYYKTHREDSLTILKKYLKTDDTEALKEVYEDLGLALLPEKPYPTLRGIEIMLRELAGTDSKAKSARPEEFADTTFIKELDTSEFIDRLYKSQRLVASRENSGSLAVSSSPRVKEKVAPAKDTARSEAVSATLKIPSTLTGTSELPQQYTVKAGDTLGGLALRFYGSSYKWAKIHQANAKTMKNPNFIYIGQQLLIPARDKPGT
jgi:NitT/TauT family transport system substrate-binding protein